MELKSYAAKSHQGPYLQVNEDGVEVDLMQKIYMVFDGFGGSNVGDKTVEFLKENIKKFYEKLVVTQKRRYHFFIVQSTSLRETLYLIQCTMLTQCLKKKMLKNRCMKEVGRRR